MLNTANDIPKRYTRIKLIISLSETALLLAFLIAVILTGFSQKLSHYAATITDWVYGQVLLFILLMGAAEMILTFPLSFYGSYILEHQYQLSRQNIFQWAWENAKALFLSALIGIPVIMLFYFCLANLGFWWWLPFGLMMLIFSVLLTRLAPTLIFPLFYRFTPLNNDALKEKLVRLCNDVNLNIAGVFEFNYSKTTKKANAAFAGIGRSKRILLADNLLNAFTDEEIEVIFAHEVGHYRHRHIPKMILAGTVLLMAGLAVTAALYDALIPVLGFTGRGDVAALPLLALLLILFGLITGPVNNLISRYYENQADDYALRKTSNPGALISGLQRLADINLSDANPHPVTEFLFYSHPSIAKRIAKAATFSRTNGSNPCSI